MGGRPPTILRLFLSFKTLPLVLGLSMYSWKMNPSTDRNVNLKQCFMSQSVSGPISMARRAVLACHSSGEFSFLKVANGVPPPEWKVGVQESKVYFNDEHGLVVS